MMISHKYKFIFLRTEKTAGSSLSDALTRALGDDVIAVEMSRPAWAKYSPVHHGALKRNFPRYFGFHAHATAKQARSVLGSKIFDNYYKFAVERNPWDRQVSLYVHRKWKHNKPADSFDRDIRSFAYRHTQYVRLNNWSIYTIGNKVVVDKIVKYESLNEELEAVFEHLGLPEPIELPKLRQYKSSRPHYSTFYTETSREMVRKWYSKEIDACEYAFEA